MANIILLFGENNAFYRYLKQRFLEGGWTVYLIEESQAFALRVFADSGTEYERLWIEVDPGVIITSCHVAAIIVLSFDMLSASSMTRVTVEQRYEESSWLAFWLYGFKSSAVVMNRIRHEMLSPSYFSLPRVYKLMQQVGIERPYWRFRSLGVEGIYSYDKRFIMEKMGCGLDFRYRFEKGEFCIESGGGKWVRVLVVNDGVYAKYYDSDKRVGMSWGIQKKILKLCRAMHLDIAEILFLHRDAHWTGYGVTPWPNWEWWESHWKEVYAGIIAKVTSGKNKTRMTKKKHMKRLILPLLKDA